MYIHSTSSGGKHEIVAATKECIRDGVVTSFEELRAHLQSQRRRLAKGKQKQVEDDHDIEESSGKVVNDFMIHIYMTHHWFLGFNENISNTKTEHSNRDVTIELTEETRAAIKTINSLMSKNKDMSIEEEDESAMWTSSSQRPRRHVNENEDSSIVPVKKYGQDNNRIPFMDVCPTTPPPSSPFFDDAEGGPLDDDDDDEEDDLKEMQRMQREVQEAEQRKRQRLE